ncbi:MAG: monovalent cation/H(+) antiporter subunit G [Planctomycetota bacterium]|jgi:multicomponent Na+:H+ antiporter subunit G
MLEQIAMWIMGVGLAFDLFGCIGLVRLPDVYNRAQAATKCVTLGTCMILLGVALRAFGTPDGAMAVKSLLCAAFVLLTSPVAAHAVCRGAYLSGVKLWEGSVEDSFSERAEDIRHEQTTEGHIGREEAETA